MIQLFKSFNMRPDLSGLEHSNLRNQKSGKIGANVFPSNCLFRSVIWKANFWSQNPCHHFDSTFSDLQFTPYIWLNWSAASLPTWRIGLYLEFIQLHWFLEIGSRFHFTREITLNNEYLSQCLSDRKVFWMTFEQLFEIFIKFTRFECSRATCILLRGQNQLLVPSGWAKARKISKNSWEFFPLSRRIDQKRRQMTS